MKHERTKGNATAMVVIAVVSVILIVVLGYRQLHRLFTTPAWVTSSDLPAGQMITQDVLKHERTSDGEGSIENLRAMIGRRLLVAKAEGEVIRPQDLVPPVKVWLAEQVPAGRVLYTLTPRNSAIPYTQLRMGDRLDVLAKGERGVRVVARDVLLIGVLRRNNGAANGGPKGRGLLTALAAPVKNYQKKSASGTPLVVAVRPGDVYPLAGIGEQEEVSTVLHGAAAVKEGKVLDIKPVPTHRQIEILNGLDRKKIYVHL